MTTVRSPARRRTPAREIKPVSFRRILVYLSLLILLSVFTSSVASAAQKDTRPPAKPKGITHVVEAGQMLFRISQAYQVKVAVLMEANRLKPSTTLRVGWRLFIPGHPGKPIRPA